MTQSNLLIIPENIFRNLKYSTIKHLEKSFITIYALEKNVIPKMLPSYRNTFSKIYFLSHINTKENKISKKIVEIK